MSTIDSNLIVFKQSNPDLLSSYSHLYRICFPHALHLNPTYLQWLYSDNPSGNLIGADAFYNDELVGQVASVPVEYLLNGTLTKGLLALNVAVHPRFQGRHLFKKLGVKMCEYGAAGGYEFVCGVANRASTLMWIRQLGFQLVQPLEASIGVGSLNMDLDAMSRTEQFKHAWSEETFAWRKANPNNPISSYKKRDRLECYAAAKGKVLPVYTELPLSSVPDLSNYRSKLASPLRLFLGLVPQEARRKNTYHPIPNRFRPSPLNLIYRSLSGRIEKLEKDHVSFSFLDFDAY